MSKSPIDDQRWERSGIQLSRHFATSTRRLRQMALKRKSPSSGNP